MSKKRVYTFQQDLEKRLKNPKFLEAWEQEILKEVEREEFKSVFKNAKDFEKEKKRLQQYARYTRKVRNI